MYVKFLPSKLTGFLPNNCITIIKSSYDVPCPMALVIKSPFEITFDSVDAIELPNLERVVFFTFSILYLKTNLLFRVFQVLY